MAGDHGRCGLDPGDGAEAVAGVGRDVGELFAVGTQTCTHGGL
ncbi:hypothetical protein ABZX12_08710 [Kribbella sp. NPDC003505]